MINGIARRIIESGSALGENPATKRTMQKTQILHGLRIATPLRKPIKLKVTRKTGSSKAKPKTRIVRITKSK
jgi:hypothetical protein